MSTDCIFCKIVAGEIPATKVYEDEDVIAFNDIHPIAPVHFMIVPKEHIESLASAEEKHQALLGKILLLAPKLAKQQGLKGFRTMINTGREGGQEVFHLHVHVFGGGASLPKT
ncbi:MAG: histidine triad nucleotide-binding protein [Methylophilaceae bacterium]|jgi:histidine triad (HIT) family protein|uniref:Histidine triad nucleotide-binding protein n=1 Tax=Methyloradius palustris TaxID=2778876 RepID=A0A8D5GCF7_9PROT|nr:histidine triad nucleotide-binding protein [Methyloradius palustris]BCM23994.1 histidine triad nucleotide-binding protein [Methyloradius palustris]HSH96673.1 histidine triad nucleotide-binding protein [Methyloradius sp.]